MFNNTDECIKYLNIGIGQNLFLSEIINTKDYSKWKNILIKTADINNFLVGDSAKFNILNITILAGYCIDKNIENELSDYYHGMLKKLELYLKSFPDLKDDDSFNSKIKNIENLFFLSTMSELSLAYQLKKYGFLIKFETPLKKLISGSKGSKKDIDITVCDDSNNQVHLEVYMPNKQFNADVFFDINQDDKSIAKKIDSKILDKFGKNEIFELNGEILLAVNVAFLESLRIKNSLPILNINSFEDLDIHIPNHINGVLFFEDEFNQTNSFHFHKLLLR